MPTFARAIQSFQSGKLSQDELLGEVDRQLTVEKISPSELLDTLKARQLVQPLPDAAYQAVLNRIGNWPQEPTVITHSTPINGDERRPRVDVGDVLQGRFKLVQLIGQGGMSRVFKAIDLRRVEAESSDPHIAIKVLTEPFSEYFGSLAALQREAHKLQNLAHPNIVRVMDCDRDGQTVFMTMEYLAGESLQSRLRARGPTGMDAATATALVIAIGHALNYAHENHIVHGDLKPGNVILTADGGVKVIDFGMARFLARPGVEPEHPETPAERVHKAVTPKYASPQLMAAQTPKPSDDVYALGCVAYEILSGKQPFEKVSENVRREPTAKPAPQPQLPAQQFQAISRALAYEEKDRTPTVAEFLSEFAGSRPSLTSTRWALIGLTALLIVISTFYWVQRHDRVRKAAEVGMQRDCPTCPLMVIVAPGHFTQGSTTGDADTVPFEQPPHAVVIGYPLAMGLNEITVGEFREFAEATHFTPSGCATYDGSWHFSQDANWSAPGFAQSPVHPVTCVSWNDAVAYAAWLSQKSGHHYRLPTASEWEYAARSGTESTRPWGGDAAAACASANVADQAAAKSFPGWNAFPCSDGYVGTAPVGSFKSNAFGLNDLLGNVFEWVEDCWHSDYHGAPADGSARMDGDCTQHEMRGGSWFSSPRFVDAAYRNRFESDYRSSSVGFRLVREVRQ